MDPFRQFTPREPDSYCYPALTTSDGNPLSAASAPYPRPNQPTQAQGYHLSQDETDSSDPKPDAGSDSKSSVNVSFELRAGVEGGANDAPPADTDDTASNELQDTDVGKITNVQDYGRGGKVLEGTGHFAKKFPGVNQAKVYMSRSSHWGRVQGDDVDEVEKQQEHHTIRIQEAIRTLPDNSADSYDRTFGTIQRNRYKGQIYLEPCAGKIVSSAIDLHRHGTHLLSDLQLEGDDVEQIKASERVQNLVDMLYVRKSVVEDILDGWKFDVMVAQPSARLQKAINTLKNNETKKNRLDSVKHEHELLRKGKDGAAVISSATSTGPKSKSDNEAGKGGKKAAGETKKGAKKSVGCGKGAKAGGQRKKRARHDSDESETEDVGAIGGLNDPEVGVTERSEIEGAAGIRETTEAEEAEDIEDAVGIEDAEASEEPADENERASDEEAKSEYEDEEAPPPRNNINTPQGHLRLGGKSVPGYVPSEGFHAATQVPSRGTNKCTHSTLPSQEARGAYNLIKRQMK